MPRIWPEAPTPNEGRARITAPANPTSTPTTLFHVAFSPPRHSCDTITVVIGVMPLITPTMLDATVCSANGNSANGIA